jgi:hypothetical protein
MRFPIMRSGSSRGRTAAANFAASTVWQSVPSGIACCAHRGDSDVRREVSVHTRLHGPAVALFAFQRGVLAAEELARGCWYFAIRNDSAVWQCSHDAELCVVRIFVARRALHVQPAKSPARLWQD